MYRKVKFFLFLDVFMKLQQQIFSCFCTFCCNSVSIVGLLRLLAYHLVLLTMERLKIIWAMRGKPINVVS